jgi:hypothetical protein
VGTLVENRWLLAVIGLHVVLALLVFEATLFHGADAGHYMVLGQALRDALGFRDIHLPGAPLHAKYPPGYPMVLAVAGWFGGLQVLKAASLAFTAGAVWLTVRVGRPILGRTGSLLVGALFAMSPVLLDFSHRVLSEATFTFCLLLVLAAARKEDRWSVAVLAAAAAAFFTRTAGLAILLSLVVHPLLTRKRREAGMALIVAVACVAGWAAYQRLVQPAQPGYLQQLVLLNPYDPSLGTIGLADVPARAARNLWRYVSSELPGSLGLPTVGGTAVPATAVTGVVLGAFVLGGWLESATRRLTLAHLVTAFYFGLILLWSPIWTDRRFLLPVLPLLLIWGALGVRTLADRVGSRVGPALAGVVVAGLVGTALISSGRRVPDRLACVASYRAGQPCERPQYAEFYAMARWVALNTPSTAVIANRSPATFFLYSRRQGNLYEYSRDPDAVLWSLEDMGADYVVVDRLSATTLIYLLPAIREHRDRFELVHTVGNDQGTSLLRLLPAPRTAIQPADP